MGHDKGLSTEKSVLGILSEVLTEVRNQNMILREQLQIAQDHSNCWKQLLDATPKTSKSDVIELALTYFIDRKNNVPSLPELAEFYGVAINTVRYSKKWKGVRESRDVLLVRRSQGEICQGHKTTDRDVVAYD